MLDSEIIELYWNRKESAIDETAVKYGRLCRKIAGSILSSCEDSEECVNDTYMALWNSIPPERPDRFSAFICSITRNLALKKYEYISAEKRNPRAVCSLEELDECVSGRDGVESEIENRQIENTISAFLWKQTEPKRNVFILRYFYFESIDDISRKTGFSQSKVKSMLFNLRRRLRTYLESEGIEL